MILQTIERNVLSDAFDTVSSMWYKGATKRATREAD